MGPSGRSFLGPAPGLSPLHPDDGMDPAGIPFLLDVQFLLSVGTLLLVWLAGRRRSRTAALVAVAILAFNPWLARQQALVMSETLGAFLVAVTVLLWPAPGRPLAPLPAFALGALAVAASLVTPAAAFVAVPVLGVLAWRNRRSAAVLGLTAAGLFVILAPWQVYLLEKTGRMEPLLLHPIGSGRTGLQMWLRTWSTTPQDKWVWWSREARREIPERALGQGPERAMILKALDEAPTAVPDTTWAAATTRRSARRRAPRGRSIRSFSGSACRWSRSVDALAGLSFDDRRAGAPPRGRRFRFEPRTGPLTPPSGA